MSNNPQSLQERIRSNLSEVFLNKENQLGLHEPRFNRVDEEYLLNCIKSGWVSSAGPYIKNFEDKISKISGTKHCIAVVNGTCGLQMALNVAGVSAGDEVLVPSLTFVATANAISHLGAIPHFIEASRNTLGIDPFYLKDYLNKISEYRGNYLYNKKTGNKITAIIPMHVFGYPVEMDELLEVTKQFNITIIEDAAEALGSTYKKRGCGSLGKLGVFSFNGNKIITSGGGGAIVTNDDELAVRLRHITTTAKVSHEWAYYHDEVGYNYRMPNLNAALGLAQLTRFDDYLRSKKRLSKIYKNIFEKFNEVEVFSGQPSCEPNHWLNAISLKPGHEHKRDVILNFLNEHKIMVRPIWEPLHTLPMYRSNPRSDLEVTEDLASRFICLPSSPHLVDNKL